MLPDLTRNSWLNRLTTLGKVEGQRETPNNLF